MLTRVAGLEPLAVRTSSTAFSASRHTVQWSRPDGALALAPPQHRQQKFLAYLRHIDINVPRSLAIHLSVDNHVIQKRPKVKAWLASRPRYHLHDTPAYACRINPVERRFGFIPQQDIRRGSFSSVKELTRKINAFVEQHNARAAPSTGRQPPNRSVPRPNDLAHFFLGRDTRRRRPTAIELELPTR